MCPESPPALGTRFGSEYVQLTSAALAQGENYGTLLLRSDLAVLALRGRFQLAVVSLLLALALGVAVVLSSRLQRIVSDPLIALANTAGEVSRQGDYSLRAARSTDDEVGDLVDAFNRMLERIESREADLSKANDELRREVADRRKAEQERAELLVREREANRLKDEFLATLSHELRTPLNAILGWTKLLRANAVPVGSVDRALEKVERNAQVQARLIEDLLEISRIVSGKLRLDLRPLDLVTLCSTAIESIRPTAETRGIVLERRFETGPMPSVGDPDRLQQVIWNLLSNAVKFTPAGGMVTLTARRLGEVDEIVVSDTGIGIDRAFLPNVFETFRQADASTTRAHGGLGLGLSIVKQLVGLHGGEVLAASEGEGRGATFTVRVPVRSIEPKQEPGAGRAAPEHRGPPGRPGHPGRGRRSRHARAAGLGVRGRRRARPRRLVVRRGPGVGPGAGSGGGGQRSGHAGRGRVRVHGTAAQRARPARAAGARGAVGLRRPGDRERAHRRRLSTPRRQAGRSTRAREVDRRIAR